MMHVLLPHRSAGFAQKRPWRDVFAKSLRRSPRPRTDLRDMQSSPFSSDLLFGSTTTSAPAQVRRVLCVSTFVECGRSAEMQTVWETIEMLHVHRDSFFGAFCALHPSFGWLDRHPKRNYSVLKHVETGTQFGDLDTLDYFIK